ncbi:hypothetical protein EGR_11187 [Echinococcus granulosus]|uniref:Uncharacterized protein n=1 Tax=Echinococcus granulosus TaxID=6210 RepID=W6U0K6_ECHGR|nr:hypothetical protein EGR_11187 [Echinococcus granulosus]EUB53956.1 hypothetical protein EGR_11187 [Echinococcus granulosus]
MINEVKWGGCPPLSPPPPPPLWLSQWKGLPHPHTPHGYVRIVLQFSTTLMHNCQILEMFVSNLCYCAMFIWLFCGFVFCSGYTTPIEVNFKSLKG